MYVCDPKQQRKTHMIPPRPCATPATPCTASAAVSLPSSTPPIYETHPTPFRADTSMQNRISQKPETVNKQRTTNPPTIGYQTKQ
ncbi:uncharacterized protein K452DRAFT_287062 [Aplosporella prunicola CBS 121167]|uniref:Uncharacterized protein n=1 Tax=Aplosporella prunicola CBS 121167 TaxID=1176127 RepID=A0A6A6BGD8_9PEZI|nr:uncharacterized protein K452DRAFT_287062 [Aplosporella prunicola CBS 121167]KAF2142648.1 hypothetical protein K452DRAFT_287062 [Aplosporella prunicola CBS 121167]